MKDRQISSNKLKTVIIVGPGSSAEYAALSNHDIYKSGNGGLIIGNGEDPISFEDIRSKLLGNIDLSTRIDVVIHSRETSDLVLQVSDGGSKTSNARNFLTMLDNCSDTPLNVELRCCFGGIAKNYLKEGSILVTHSSENQFLYGDLGTHSLKKILDKRLIALRSTVQSNIEHPIFKVMDDIKLYAINPVKISLSGKEETAYSFRHPSNLLLRSESIKRYLQNQVDNCRDIFSEKIGRESVSIDISSEECLDYLYGSIANETEGHKIVKVLEETAKTYPDIFIELLTKKIGSHDLITHFVDTSEVEVIKSIIDTSTKSLINDPQSMSLLSLLSENIISMKQKKEDLGYIFGDKKTEEIIENNEVIFEYLASKLKNTKISLGPGKDETLLTHCIKKNDTKFIAILSKTKSYLNQINSKGDNAIDVALQQISRIRQNSTLSKDKKQKMENEYNVVIKNLAKSGIDITEKNISGLLNKSNDNDLIVSVISRCENKSVISAIKKKINKEKEGENIDLPVGEEVKRSLMQIKMTLQQNFRSISGFRDFLSRAIVAAVDADHVLLQGIIDIIPERNIPEIMIKVIEAGPSVEEMHKLSSTMFDYLNDRPGITKENMTNIMKGLLQSDILRNASENVKESFVKLIPEEKRGRLDDYMRIDPATKRTIQRSENVR